MVTSGILPLTPRLQWRGREGLSPSSLFYSPMAIRLGIQVPVVNVRGGTLALWAAPVKWTRRQAACMGRVAPVDVEQHSPPAMVDGASVSYQWGTAASARRSGAPSVPWHWEIGSLADACCPTPPYHSTQRTNEEVW